MEFKGHLGKWINKDGLVENKDGITICNCYVDNEKDEYNALLISKAPEMLEMLQNVSNVFHLNGKGDDLFTKEIDELIKQATIL